ncbi:hypothetical protein [Phenylobacterium sp.]|uniref:hypothetical protein n=1 Tax=Phenylobacterium sp. TaxID=1871053 RepID=UPI002B6051A8|nr:hypothetical protein [Phenylobacterium sp.]HVI31038.1 hypothetical protein [Phenylobacterium sp.]
MKLKIALLAACCLAASPAGAAEFTVRGTGAAAAKGNPQTVRALATRAAKRKAVIAAIEKVLGAGTTANPAVAARIDSIVEQVGDETIADSSAQNIAGQFEVSLTLSLDDRAFRELLSDQGVALNTSTARSYSLLAVMDEYRTTPRDLKAPVEELVEFSTRKGASFSDRSSQGASSRSASAQASRSASTIDARSSESSSASGRYSESLKAKGAAQASGSGSANMAASTSGQGGAASLSAAQQAQFSARQSGSVNAKSSGQFSGSSNSASSVRGSASASSASAQSSGSSSFSRTDVQAEVHDDLSYRKLVKYQPQATAPENLNRTYAALLGQLRGYDLRVLDNDVFRSRYFQNQPLTLEKMTSSGELARYVSYARKDQAADFFMAGTSVIVDSGINAATGQYACSGVVTVKAYSTVDGESIAGETMSAYGSGINTDACADDVARKLAMAVGPEIGSQVQTYWKQRGMYGRELVLRLTGSFIPLPVRARFSQAVASLPGVESSVQRTASSTEVELTVSYKGAEPIDQALAMALASDPSFATLDSRTEGQRVVLCLSACRPGV